MARQFRWRRALRTTAMVVGSLLGVVILLVGAFLVLSSVREGALREGLRRGVASLPGDFRVERARWPHRGELHLEGVLWTADSRDTLLAADTVRLRFDWSSLFHREVHVRTLEVDGLWADVPAMAAAFPPADSTGAARRSSTEAYTAFFPREGGLAGFPSLALDTLRVHARRLKLAPGQTVLDARLDAGITLLAAGEPGVALRRLEAVDAAGLWRLDRARLDLDPGAGRLGGELLAELQGQPLALEVRSPADDSLELTLSSRPGARPPEVWGATATIHLQRERFEFRGLEARVQLRTPGTSDLPDIAALAGRLPEGLPDLEPLDAELTLRADLGETLDATLGLRLEPNAWQDGGRAEARIHNGRAVLDTLELRLPELIAGVSGTLFEDRLDARGRVTARGLNGVRPFLADATLPDSLRLDLRFTAAGPLKAPDLAATLRSAFVMQGTRVDRLDITARRVGSGPVSCGVQAQALGFGAAMQTEVTLETPVVTRISPIVIRENPRADITTPGFGNGRIVYDPATRAARVEMLRVEGDLGSLRANARADSAGRGEFSLEGRWTDLPRIVAERLTDDPARADSLRARWRRHGFYLVQLRGQGRPAGGGTALEVNGAFSLPGPQVFAPVLPPGAEVDSLGDFRGEFDAVLTPRSWGQAVRANLLLDRTNWLDSARVVIRTEDRRVRLESLVLELEGVRLVGNGSMAGEVIDFDGSMAVARLDFFRRFLGEAGQGLDGSLAGAISLRGTRAAPQVEVDFSGDARYRAYRVPGFAGRARFESGRLAARFGLTEAAEIEQVVLDRADLSFTSRADSLFPARITVDIEGPDVGLVQRLDLDRDTAWTVVVDTLGMRVRDLGLDARHAFRVTVDPKARTAEVDSMDLAGNLGTLRLQGSVAPDRADLDLLLDARLPEKPPFLELPEGLWPARATLDLRARGTDELRAVGSVSGFSLGERTDVRFDLEVSAGDSTVDATLSLVDARGEMMRGEVELPGRVSLAPVRAQLRDGTVLASVLLTGLPLPRPDETGRGVDWTQPMQLDGELGLRGVASDPSAFGDLKLSFPGWPRLGLYRLDIEGELTGDSGTAWGSAFGSDPGRVIDMADSLQTALSLLSEVWSASRPSRLRTAFAFQRGERRVLRGHVGMPLEVSLHPFLVESAASDTIDAALEISQLALRDLDALLPPDVSLSGILDVDFRARGPRENPGFGGSLKARDVKAELAGKARATARSDLAFSGDLARPVARGKVEVQTAVIQIPEQQKTVLPARGDAILWRTEGLEGTPVDTLQVGAVRDSASSTQALEADLDVAVVIPSAFWIRGRGLDVELAGDLRVIQKGTAPTVTGELKAVQGRLVFLGRTFEVERGEVVFYGGDTVNPSLDLLLTTSIQGTLFNIEVKGTALEPKLTLSSDPEMTEGDIMAFLLFGRPIDELDTEQQGLLEQRAGEVARSFAMAQIEARLAQQLGVDLVSIRSGNGDDQSDSLVIGKYLSRRALLKYEQALEGTANFFLNLEYLLTRNLKLDTLIGPRSQSGIEIRWGTEY